jgi:hypothetical protein
MKNFVRNASKNSRKGTNDLGGTNYVYSGRDYAVHAKAFNNRNR